MAISLVLDTSAYSAFNRGDERLRGFFTTSNTIYVPVITVGELKSGFAAGNQQTDNEKLLQRFLDSPNVSVLAVTLNTTTYFASVYASLRQAGTPIGTNDVWIAALAVEHNVPLLTLDQDFTNVPNVECLNIPVAT